MEKLGKGEDQPGGDNVSAQDAENQRPTRSSTRLRTSSRSKQGDADKAQSRTSPTRPTRYVHHIVRFLRRVVPLAVFSRRTPHLQIVSRASPHQRNSFHTDPSRSTATARPTGHPFGCCSRGAGTPHPTGNAGIPRHRTLVHQCLPQNPFAFR